MASHKYIPHDHFDAAGGHICAVQMENGAIPWFENGVVDPWNHLEAVMALNLLGMHAPAQRGYEFLFNTQLADGSWWGQMGNAVPMDDALRHFRRDNYATAKKVRDTNFISYIATAILHHYLLYQDKSFLRHAWPHVEGAFDFVLSLQSAHGEIRWAAPDPQTPEDDALLAGNASIYKSLNHACILAQILGETKPLWQEGYHALRGAICEKPHRFDRQWEAKTRFSMDWYYPLLCGAISGAAAQARLAARWDLFVIDGFGCRCVSDEPWITAAESAELVLTLAVLGMQEKARTHLAWLETFRNSEGLYWMGYQLEEETYWPQETPPWTSGAVILAHDAVHQLSPACTLFMPDTLFAV